MKKILTRDHKNRKLIKQLELKKFILKQLSINSNLLISNRWKAYHKLHNFAKKNSKVNLSNRCIKTINRKTFHKFTKFSRIIFLKLAKLGKISYLRKSSW